MLLNVGRLCGQQVFTAVTFQTTFSRKFFVDYFQEIKRLQYCALYGKLYVNQVNKSCSVCLKGNEVHRHFLPMH